MGVLLWILLGAISGWIASLVMRTNANQGMFMDIILGIIGALVGGLIFNFFGAPGVTGFNIYSMVVSVVGAVVLIALSRLVYRTV
ncbi:GlsB/YeaQ/YmgE family stress response membrane protein [Candidatus Microgenomates bacterium]|nr:GlsB/YeaQ/YmgE family stress response membrane protein [Candidatus Microgenomates bacterium]